MKQEITEKCGVFGMIGEDSREADFRLGFAAQQNRGDDAAGKVMIADHVFESQTVDGRILELFDGSEDQTATVFLGHNRYTTSMGMAVGNRQPIIVSSESYTLALAHNGNLPDDGLLPLRAAVKDLVPPDASDSAVMAQVLLEERKKYGSWTETFMGTLPLFQGAFSLACVTEEECLYVLRDPWGIRPMCLGRKGNSWMVASESAALSAAGAEYLRELLPGELIRIDPQGKFESYIYAVRNEPEQRCLLETIYFSRNSSFDGELPMWAKRRALGRAAAKRFKQKNIAIDLIIPILNSGREMTIGVAEELDQQHVEAIQVQGERRSFIQNTNGARRKVVHEKHIVAAHLLAGKKILLCDDSLIRGISLQVLIQKIQSYRDQLPSEIHVLLGSEPVIDICDLGVDMSTRAELAAGNIDGGRLAQIEQAIAVSLGVDSVAYTDRTSMEMALKSSGPQMCWNCFGGPHPVRDNPTPTYRHIAKPKLEKQKVLFLASGGGTNVENLLKNMASGNILAKPLGVITNNETARVKDRAAQYGVSTTVITSRGRLKDAASRHEYEAELLEQILTDSQGLPDVIVLAGWMLVLSDNFLKPLTQAGVEVINLHPALLSGVGADFVMSSQGRVPELRGAHAIEDATALPLTVLPVTGVTIHRVVPAGIVDTGQVILKEEVARKENETVEGLTARIHEAEYRSFPIALQKVLLERIAKEAV